MDYKRDVSKFLLVALRCQWVNIFCDILEVFDLASDRLPKFMAKKGSSFEKFGHVINPLTPVFGKE